MSETEHDIEISKFFKTLEQQEDSGDPLWMHKTNIAKRTDVLIVNEEVLPFDE